MSETAPAPATTTVIPRTEGEQIPGSCKAWNVEKGYGFFACDDGGEDIFMHQSCIQLAEAKFRAILPGTKLVATYSLREGKSTCASVTGAEGAALPGFESKLIATQKTSRASSAPGSCFGKVKWFNAEKGFGFIVPEDGSEDVFCNIKDVEANVPLQAEAPVQYQLTKQSDGRDRAVSIKNLGASPAAPAFYQQPAAYPYGAHPVQPYGYSPYGAPPAAAGMPQGMAQGMAPPSAGMKAGTIKWFNAEKGFGFIIPSAGGTEIYFRANAIQGGTATPLTEADPVEYEEKNSSGKSWASVVISKSRKRKAGGPYEGYEANAMYKAARPAAYGQPGQATQFDPYGQPAGAPAAGQFYPPQQFEQQPGAAPAGYPQQPPAQGRPAPGGFQAEGQQGAYYPPAGAYY